MAFVLLITLPFADQPLHVDDSIFWDFAQANLESPFQQHLPDYHLMGEDVPSFRDTHPPFDGLYQALVMRLTGSAAESTLHLSFIVFPLIAGVSMFFLGRRFLRHPLWAALLLLATPTVMVMSHNLMGDVPLMAFWLASTTTYIYGVDRQDTRLLAAAGLLVTLAIFTGYQALALLLLLPLYAWLQRRLSLSTVAPLALPLLAFAWYSWYNLSRYGAWPRFSHARGLSLDQEHLLSRLEGIALQLGGASVFPLALIAAFALKKRHLVLLPLLFGGGAALAAFGYRELGWPLASAVLAAIFLSATLSVVAAILLEAARQLVHWIKGRTADRDFLFLGIWFLALMAGVILLLPHATAKYCLPFFAPLILLFYRGLEAKFSSPRLLQVLTITTISLTGVTGLAIATADYRLARTYQDYAANLAESYQGEGTVWFVGEWGFRHYMEQQGYRYLTSTNTSPQEGDIIVSPSVSDWPLAESVTRRMLLVQVDTAEWALPLRVMSLEAKAGFYGSHWGLLPFTFTQAPLERFEVYEISSA